MTKTKSGCQARRYSDQMLCGTCGLAWDVNDPEPPACQPEPSSALSNRAAPYETPRRLDMLIGSRVLVDGIEEARVAGFKEVAGEVYFSLDGWRRPVLSTRCEPVL